MFGNVNSRVQYISNNILLTRQHSLRFRNQEEYKSVLGASYDEVYAQTQNAWVKEKGWGYSETIRHTMQGSSMDEKNTELDKLMKGSSQAS